MPNLDLDRIAESLEKVTEELALQVGGNGNATPAWPEFDWKIAQAAVAMHGIGPMLGLNLQWQVPLFWQTFLAEQSYHNRVRHQRIQVLTDSLLDEFKQAGIRVVMLKGVALYRAGCYAGGERPMGDIDVLMSAEHRRNCAAILSRMDYHLVISKRREDSYENANPGVIHALGEHAENPIKIEIHSRIYRKLLSQHWDITDFIFPRPSQDSMGAYPGSCALMAHLLLRSAGCMQAKTLRILHLCDIARLATVLTADDWDKIGDIRAGGRPPWWAFPPLKLTCRYFPSAVPPNVMEAFESVCPAFLRSVARRTRITNVSFSHLWISAFPGIEWASSASDLVQYVLKRIVLDSEIHAQKRVEAGSPFWGNDGWARLPQWRRALRWLTSRPPRTGTMIAINSVLSE